ncbi:MAG: tRNA dihydrouridine synthase DusB [Acidobacteriota bacterium]
MILKHVIIEPGLALAPIAGFTDTYFRREIKKLGGCGLIFSEMVSSEALTRDSKRSHKIMEFSHAERPIAIQISGANRERMALAAKIVEDSGADILDINMGCPVSRIVKTGAGAALINDPALVARVLRAVTGSVTIPVTVKIRSGWQKWDRKGIELSRIAEENGAAAITVHARSRSDSFKEKAEWPLIGEVKYQVKIPVIGNGDVKEAEDAIRMKRETGCDAVMIGRAAMSNPWIFRQIMQIERGEVPEVISAAERNRFALEHFRILLENEEDRIALHRMRSFAGWYFRRVPGALQYRRLLNSIKTAREFLETSLDYLS